ncbi:MAG: tRNA (guanosine(37)-N1)-methyltransferase TrmD [Candidatus Pacebacteria bacterium]|nr:tRNA (guanosine(37)-N1)-methyltransferase TrmD [Candidatus Paceibacterota bacterium]
MTFHIITIFPEIFDSYFKEGILRRAQQKKKIKIKIYNLRDFTDDKRKTVDDRPFGGGPGMVLKIDPIQKTINKIKKSAKKKTRIILLSAKGKKLDQKKAKFLTKYKDVILICGRYEGVDERVAKYIANEEISIGDYILSGGELGAMVIIEAVSRLIPGVLGNKESIEDKREVKGYPVYTRPEKIKIDKKERSVPKILLSGDHKKIEKWRSKQAK